MIRKGSGYLKILQESPSYRGNLTVYGKLMQSGEVALSEHKTRNKQFDQSRLANDFSSLQSSGTKR